MQQHTDEHTDVYMRVKQNAHTYELGDGFGAGMQVAGVPETDAGQRLSAYQHPDLGIAIGSFTDVETGDEIEGVLYYLEPEW